MQDSTGHEKKASESGGPCRWIFRISTYASLIGAVAGGFKLEKFGNRCHDKFSFEIVESY